MSRKTISLSLALSLSAVAAAVLALWALGCRPADQEPAGPPYFFHLRLAESRPGSEQQPLEKGQPLKGALEAYLSPREKEPVLLACPATWGPAGVNHAHPLQFVVKDPDGLASLWRRSASPKDLDEDRKRWMAASSRQPVRTEFDLRDWAPAWYEWSPGWHEARCFAQTEMLKPGGSSGAAFFRVGKAPALLSAQRAPVLKAVLESNQTAFAPGEIIVLRGWLENVGRRPFLIQTRLPFREAQLVDSNEDTFPAKPYAGPVRLSDFTRLEPGQKVKLFEESFIAGQADPHWGIGLRGELFPQPFWGEERTIRLVLQSEGLFPEDRQPELGIWTGEARSDKIKITCKARPKSSS